MEVEGMRSGANRLAARCVHILRSKRFFWIIFALLALQAVWFAISARYPMAFDENIHFGLVQLHAQQWLPFFTSQPAHAEIYGPVARDPSYLYHFLLSLPYRLIARFTQNQNTQVTLLRFINIGLGLTGFVLTRKLLFRLGVSRALAHTSLLLFTLVPITPFLIAQVNYDNLFFPILVASLLLTFSCLADLKQRRMSFIRASVLAIFLLLGSLVKYAFLPIALVLGVVITWQVARNWQNHEKLSSSFMNSLLSTPRWLAVGLVGLTVVSLSLFGERYVVNLVRYRTPSPDCGQVLSTQDCLQYAPWARDYQYVIDKGSKSKPPSKLEYIWQWPYGMWFRSFFAISDTYDTQPVLPIPAATVVFVGGIGVALFIVACRRIVKRHLEREIVIMAMAVYLLALFQQTFFAYLRTSEPVAINGRYVLPFVPVIIALVGLAYSELLRHRPAIKAWAAVAAVVLFAYGGGALTFLLRSKDVWYWPNDTVVKVNHTVRQTIAPLIIGGQLPSADPTAREQGS